MLEEMMLAKKIWAVVGASENTQRYGYKIYKKLKAKGYTVYPVNPNYETISGEKCYKDLASLPEVPEVVNMVVSPKIGKPVIAAAEALGIKNIWLQPGTEDDELLTDIEEKGMLGVQACVLVALR